jgi:hypothetical protein
LVCGLHLTVQATVYRSFLLVTTGFGRSRAFPGNLFVGPGIFVGPGLCAPALLEQPGVFVYFFSFLSSCVPFAVPRTLAAGQQPGRACAGSTFCFPFLGREEKITV